MLTQPQLQRYSNESGLRDIIIAEKEVVLTFCYNYCWSAAFSRDWPSREARVSGKCFSEPKDDSPPISTSPASRITITRKSFSP